MPGVTELQKLAHELQADPSKHAGHVAKLLEALQSGNEVRS